MFHRILEPHLRMSGYDSSSVDPSVGTDDEISIIREIYSNVTAKQFIICSTQTTKLYYKRTSWHQCVSSIPFLQKVVECIFTENIWAKQSVCTSFKSNGIHSGIPNPALPIHQQKYFGPIQNWKFSISKDFTWYLGYRLPWQMSLRSHLIVSQS